MYNNHYKDPYYGWDDHQPYSEYWPWLTWFDPWYTLIKHDQATCPCERCFWLASLASRKSFVVSFWPVFGRVLKPWFDAPLRIAGVSWVSSGPWRNGPSKNSSGWYPLVISHNSGKSPFIVSFPMNSMVIFHSYVSLAEGISSPRFFFTFFLYSDLSTQEKELILLQPMSLGGRVNGHGSWRCVLAKFSLSQIPSICLELQAYIWTWTCHQHGHETIYQKK